MDLEQQKIIKQKLLGKKFKEVDLADLATLDYLLRMVQNLQPIPDNFKLVKTLLTNYGFPIMIFLKQFYDNLSEQTWSEHKEDLQKLGSIALQMSDGQSIDQLSYIYKQGVGSQKYKSKKKNKQEKEFINNMVELSEMKKKLNQKSVAQIEFAQLAQKFSSSYKKMPFLYNSFEKILQTNIGEEESCHSISVISEATDIEVGQYSINGTLKQSQVYMTEKDMLINCEKYQAVNFVQSQVQQVVLAPTPSQKSMQFSIDSSSENEINQSSVTVVKHKSGETMKTQFICCRPFFYEFQQLKENENEGLAYLNCRYPFRNIEILSIKEVICSFLNSDGGTLFIGVNKQQNGKKVVEGAEYNESQKQTVLTSFRQLVQVIEPDIITQKMYRIDFVPIKSSKTGKYIPGGFLIRINVRYGIRDDIYSYRDGNRDCFPFRNQNEIIHKEGRILLKILKERIRNPLPVPIPLHSGLCRSPEQGEQLYGSEKTKNQKNIQKYDAKPSWPPEQSEYKRDLAPVLMTKKKQTFTSLQTAKKPDTIFEKILPQSILSQQQTSTKKQTFDMNKWSASGYFYVVGVNENQLSPVFEKKGILHEIKIDSTRNSRLVLRAYSEQVIEKLRKILKKIEQKYSSLSIKVYQITRSLEVGTLSQARLSLTEMKCEYQITKNVIHFQRVKDSLHLFLLLEDKMQVCFVSP